METFAALGNAPLQIGTLFLDNVLRCTEDEIAKHEASHISQPRSGAERFGGKCNNRYRPYQTSWDHLGIQAGTPSLLDRIDFQHGVPFQQGADLTGDGTEASQAGQGH